MPEHFALESLQKFDSLFGNLPKEQQQKIRTDLRKSVARGIANRREDALERFLESQKGKKDDWPVDEIAWLRRPVVSRGFETNEKSMSRLADNIVFRVAKEQVWFGELSKDQQRQVMRLAFRFSERLVLEKTGGWMTPRLIEFRKELMQDVDSLFVRHANYMEALKEAKAVLARHQQAEEKFKYFSPHERLVAKGLLAAATGFFMYYFGQRRQTKA